VSERAKDMNCPHCGKRIKILGHQELAALIGWDRRTLSTYKYRNQLPKPDFELACGPIWYEDNKEIQEFIRKHKRVQNSNPF
jgi:hypothetical protein